MAGQETGTHIEQWLNGDESAFKVVVEQYFHKLYAFSKQMVKNSEDAEELTMNALLKLWQHKYRIVSISKPEQYLFGILRQEVVAHARKRVLLTDSLETVNLEKLGTVDHPELKLEELRNKYQSALNKLTPTQKMVFQLSREQNFTQQEIVDQTGMSINTVGNHMNAALKVFRREMQEYPDALILVMLACPATVHFLVQ